MKSTGSKKIDRAILEGEEFSSTLLRLSPNPIHVLSADTSLIYINPAFERLTGFSSSDILGIKCPYYPWWLKDQKHQFEKILTVDGFCDGLKKELLPFNRKDGEVFWAEVTSVPVRSGTELKYYLSNWIDVTKEKKLCENMEFYIAEITKTQEEERKRIYGSRSA